LLDAAHYVASFRTVLPEDQRSLLPAGYQPDAASPIESLETYLRLKSYDEKQQAKLLAAARDLIATTDGAHA
jgi:hypothetical protein